MDNGSLNRFKESVKASIMRMDLSFQKEQIDRLKKLLDEVRPFAAFPDVETAKAWHDAVTKELRD